MKGRRARLHPRDALSIVFFHPGCVTVRGRPVRACSLHDFRSIRACFGESLSGGIRSGLRYRPEIDGLRAVSVLTVIVYHARFTVFGERILQGGFLGVDLFFLISGFLITMIVATELREKRFSLLRFYERRARRILPALICVLVSAALVAPFLMSPIALFEFAQSLVATILFYSNIHFLFQDSYTAEPSQLQPLLHTWSLSVEEQFYLVLPVLLILIGRRRWPSGTILVGLAVLSLVLAHLLVTKNTALAFFLPLSRAWELLVGSILAVGVVQGRIKQSDWTRFLPTLGAAMICLSFAFFDESTPHPSLLTLVPILGGVFLIGWSNPGDPTTRLLSSRAFVGIGLASYSLYLWHFPIFAFLRIANDGSGTASLMALGIALTGLLSAATWRWVEQPFRRQGWVSQRWLVFATGLPMAAMLVFATFILTRPVDTIYSSIPQAVQNSFSVFEPRRGATDCIDQDGFMDPKTWCQLGPAESAPSFLLVGDSHAEAIAASVDAAAFKLGLSGRLVARSGCPLLLGLEPDRGVPLSAQCVELAIAALDFAKSQGIPVVILASRWNYYTCGEPKPDCGFTQNIRSIDEAWPKTLDEREEVLAAALRQTIETYSEAGMSVRIIAQVPHQPYDPREVFEAYFGGIDDALISMALPTSEHASFSASVRKILDSVVEDYPGTQLHDPATLLCAVGGICRVGTPEASFYSDDDHLSIGAAPLLSHWVEALIR